MTRAAASLCVLSLATLARADDAAAPPDAGAPAAWAAQREPGGGAPQAIGRYGGGCLDGAARLPEKGRGFFVTRPERGRVFGHPAMIALIRELGARVLAAHLPALPIGDVSQPRGGPAPTGHASHQTGLDVDVWYRAPGAGGRAAALVDLATNRLLGPIDGAIARMLELVARDPRVDRLFVHPAIKRALCGAIRGDRAWLGKVRPWWGHHDHFHVRLPCPPDSPRCEPQAPLAPGDGCGELAWWFKKADDERAAEKKRYQGRVGAAAALPGPCGRLLAEGAPGAESPPAP